MAAALWVQYYLVTQIRHLAKRGEGRACWQQDVCIQLNSHHFRLLETLEFSDKPCLEKNSKVFYWLFNPLGFQSDEYFASRLDFLDQDSFPNNISLQFEQNILLDSEHTNCESELNFYLLYCALPKLLSYTNTVHTSPQTHIATYCISCILCSGERWEGSNTSWL